MKRWDVREISPNEFHVIETRFASEPEFVLARCSGPVPAWDIVYAMRISQRLQESDSIRNILSLMESSLKIFEQEIKTMKKG